MRRENPIDPEKEWTDFWEPIISEAHEEAIKERPDVTIEAADISEAELEQIKKELSDYSMLISSLSIIYCQLTGGRVSKPNTDPYAVLGEIEERMQEDIDREVNERLPDSDHMAEIIFDNCPALNKQHGYAEVKAQCLQAAGAILKGDPMTTAMNFDKRFVWWVNDASFKAPEILDVFYALDCLGDLAQYNPETTPRHLNEGEYKRVFEILEERDPDKMRAFMGPQEDQ